ncbi:hypothetical protein Y032_0040g234 [Ancylostoma ceylanicum]|uniref:CCHC-type domain-containing protein n=1 Tax=Ancylostoma ceylanicum TaxID=53326 RepID=A0A016UGM1_9BILA|nr:hypothetical protein Y032_0040g234 [Ancylostoma ceylanicum]
MAFSSLRSSSVPVKRGRFDGYSPSYSDSIERLRTISDAEPIPNYVKLIMEVLMETKKEVTVMNERVAELIKENTQLREEDLSLKRTVDSLISSGSPSFPIDGVNKPPSEQVQKLSQQPIALPSGSQLERAGSSQSAATQGFSRVARRERWSTTRPESNVTRIIASVLTGVSPRLDDRCFNCGEAGHAAPQCPKKDGNRPTHRFQNKPRWNGRNSNANPVPSNAVGGITLADEIDGWCRAAQEGENHRDLLPRAVGQPCVCNVKIFGVTTKALIDTGSVISIVPVGLLKMARQQGVNFDAEAAKVGSGNERTLIDASGNPMGFLAELVANVRVQEAGKAPVHLHVQRTQDTTLLLGTNALSELGITIIFSTSASDADGLGASPVSDNIVKAANGIIVPPGCVAAVKVEGPGHGSCLFRSQTERIDSGVCLVKQNQADIPIVNRGSEPWVIQKGEQLGEWSTESWVDPKVADIPGDMLSLSQPIMANADRVASLITILDLSRKAGPMPDEIRRVVGEYHDVFAISDLELTQTNLVDHDIDVGGHPPIKQKTRPVPYGIRAEVESMQIDLKDRKVVEDSQSPWASPIVLVAKKDGTIRLCVDYREVNKVTKKDSYPLPPIDITLQNLQGKRWFTSLDLASGYWQVPLTARAKEISAFTTTSGQFQFRVLPFGLTTAPTKFQRLMEHVLGDLKGPEVSVYIDDILIATDSAERHVQVLKRVLEAF